MSKSFLCVQDFCPCTAFVNFLETSCYSWKPPGNGLNFTSLETVLHTKSFLGNCLVHCTFPNSVQLGNLVLFGCAAIVTSIRTKHQNRTSCIVNALLGSTVVSPYVGMARKQNGGYNASISVQTLIFHLVVNSTRLFFNTILTHDS